MPGPEFGVELESILQKILGYGIPYFISKTPIRPSVEVRRTNVFGG